MSLFILVNNVKSKFAKTLQTALRAKVVDKVYRVDHTWKPRRQDPKVFMVTHKPLNKIEQLVRFADEKISCPQFALSKETARDLPTRSIFARTLVNSTGGKGIVEFEKDQEVYPDAPLYTEYIPKKAEYRVHIFNGEVIDIQQKKKRTSFDSNSRNTRIRNVANGYVYTREGITKPADIDTLAINAVNSVGYKYGAVDIIYNEKRNQCYVLEVNSRPGIVNSTCTAYVNAIIKHYNLTRKQI